MINVYHINIFKQCIRKYLKLKHLYYIIEGKSVMFFFVHIKSYNGYNRIIAFNKLRTKIIKYSQQF
jgi:hypothetical protein